MYNVIFDCKRTIYDPETKDLIHGALALFTFLQKENVPMVLIGKGDSNMDAEVDRLGIRKYFTTVVFKEGTKSADLFVPFINKTDARHTIVIGDRVRSELALGNELGTTTIWVRQGKFAAEEPEHDRQKPTYTLPSLAEVMKLLTSLFADNA